MNIERHGVKFNDVLDQEAWIIDHNIDALYLALPTLKSPPETVVDIGAHVGFTSLMAASDKRATVWSFEPNIWSFRHLLNNIERNTFEELCQPLQLAVTSKTGEWVPLRMVPKSPGQSSLLYRKEIPVFCWAMSVSLADIVKLVGTTIDFMKIDTEGGEYDILLNSPDEVFKNISALKVELHDITDKNYFTGETKPEAIKERMKSLGYRAHEKMDDLWLRGC